MLYIIICCCSTLTVEDRAISVSVGDYEHDFKSIDFTNALLALKKEQEPTLVVVPEAVYMEEGRCYKVQTAALCTVVTT